MREFPRLGETARASCQPPKGKLRRVRRSLLSRARTEVATCPGRLGADRLVHPAGRPARAYWSGPADRASAGRRLAGRLGSVDYRVHSTCRCSLFFRLYIEQHSLEWAVPRDAAET